AGEVDPQPGRRQDHPGAKPQLHRCADRRHRRLHPLGVDSGRGVAVMRAAVEVIQRPLISEKSYAAMATGKYLFRVHPRATKTDAGRNAQGKLTVRHQGGGHRKLYRIIDFKRNKLNIPATVSAVEYDPNRSARIALLTYADGEKRYILAPVGLTVGDKVISGPEADIKPGK